jgi:hypothetical protein
MRYYIIDNTIRKEPFIYNSVNEIVKHLETAVQRKFRQTRRQYMQNLIDLGYGYDDVQGKVFTQSLSEYFNIGTVRKDGSLVKGNIHEVDQYSKYRTEMGD